ncbi:formylglycine-generating enzyme family protein [Sphaerotilus montanus]|uniref:formylglycine-generating enzyme family protein n=1 Tax=Sphaerotilus montanus TaxID=522889 RepID=UPI003FA2EEFF
MTSAAVGLADLLHLLRALPEEEHVTALACAGFVLLPERQARQEDRRDFHEDLAAGGLELPELPQTEDPPVALDPPVAGEQVQFWRVVSVVDNPRAQVEKPAWLTDTPPATEADLVARPADAASVAPEPLMPAARYAAFLRRQLTRPVPVGDLDVSRITWAWARGRMLTRLPQRRVARWPARVTLVLDNNPVSRRYQGDFWPLIRQTRHWLGARVEWLVTDNGPQALWNPQDRRPAALRADGRTLLLFGDAGVLSDDDERVQQWAHLARRLAAAGAPPLWLTPAGPAQAQPLVEARMRVCLLDRADRPGVLSRSGIEGAAEVAPAVLRAFVACFHGNPCIDPGSVRAVRLALLAQGWPLALRHEAALYRDPALAVSGTVAAVRGDEHKAAVRAEFLALPVQLRMAVVAAQVACLGGQSPLLVAEYAQCLRSDLPKEDPLQPLLDAECQRAQGLYQCMAVLIDRTPHSDEADALALQADTRGYLCRYGDRVPERLCQAPAALQTAWALAHRERLQRGELVLPAGIAYDEMVWLLDAGTQAEPLALTLCQLPPSQGAGPLYELRLCPMSEAGAGSVLQRDLPAVTHWAVQRTGEPDVAQVRGLVDLAIRFVDGNVERAKTLVDAWLKDGTLAQGLTTTLVTGARVALYRLLLGQADSAAGWQKWLAPVAAGLLSKLVDAVPAQQLVDSLLAVLPKSLFEAAGEGHTLRWADGLLSAREAVVVSAGQGCRVTVGERTLEVEAFSRPEWAESIWFDRGEWHAALPGGRELIWTPASKFRLDVDRRDLLSLGLLSKACWWDGRDKALMWAEADLGWASATGEDDYGLWAEFTVQGRRSLVKQRLRWIPPGEFLMGSPETEDCRHDNERQHPVLLTQGYWLADTACTQELWEAVMGENPSRFKEDPQNPVERVSWDDVTQNFLPRLNKLVPGLNLTLPTEAQWEYACRADTQTRYSFGDEIHRKQVNFGGKTVPVKELPANRWGLHQMLGNVWEWCIDELAAYSEGTSIDPVVHQDKKEKDRQRVLRGGSWFDNGAVWRSANRYAFAPVDRISRFGFRLARGLADQPDQPRQYGELNQKSKK